MANSVIIRRVLRNILAFLIAALVLCQFLQAPPSFSQSDSVVINEFVPNPVGPDDASKPNGEWIELHNLTGEIDLVGWVLKDKYDNHILEIIPENTDTGGTIIEKEGYLVAYRNGEKDFSLNQDDDQIRLFDGGGNLVDSIIYSGSVGEGKSWSLKGTEWVKDTDPTPGAENSFPEQETGNQQEEKQPQPTINFSSPSTVSVDTPFSVSVTFKNFKAGTYSLKVLIGKGDKFYDGRTKGTDGKWLAWNAGWADFPKVSAGSSGSGSKSVQVKTDGDVVAGSYLVKVRAYDGKNTFDSATKPLIVAESAKSGGTSGASGSEESSSNNPEEILGEVTGGDGGVKGEEAPQNGGFKLNFYTILGTFGMVVGSGGLILAFRKRVRRSQTPDTPESEQETPS